MRKINLLFFSLLFFINNCKDPNGINGEFFLLSSFNKSPSNISPFLPLDGGGTTGLQSQNDTLPYSQRPKIFTIGERAFVIVPFFSSIDSKYHFEVFHFSSSDEETIALNNTSTPLITNSLPSHSDINNIAIIQFQGETILGYGSGDFDENLDYKYKINLYRLNENSNNWTWTNIPFTDTNYGEFILTSDNNNLYLSLVYSNVDFGERGLHVYKTANLNSPSWIRIDGGSIQGLKDNTTTQTYNVISTIIDGKLTLLWEESLAGTHSLYIKQFNGSTWQNLTNGLAQIVGTNSPFLGPVCSGSGIPNIIFRFRQDDNLGDYIGFLLLRYDSINNIWVSQTNPNNFIRYNIASSSFDGYLPVGNLVQSCVQTSEKIYFNFTQHITTVEGWNSFDSDRLFFAEIPISNTYSSYKYINRNENESMGIGYDAKTYDAFSPVIHNLSTGLIQSWIQIKTSDSNDSSLRIIKHNIQ
ncbi:hypothetical protein EHO58_19025 [Leptospira selangorensis]|uniref:hypothetical protein n=1 Tax=Leptospira selangorensis TaxID=2484982 RepID=UPI001083D151|nr:hypothetical protein [Leptospira selangorensis]TGK00542.1 hypothetical protein EHO58_19025 [Leptospira selangorensis]